MKNQKAEEHQEAYELCEKIFCTGSGIMEAGDDFALDNHDKQDFFRILFAHFAKIKQKELIKEGIY